MKREDFIDDSALDNALSDEEGLFMNLAEHLSKIDFAPPTDVPPREGLYSTPLSWERPQPGLRMDSLIGLGSQALNEAEQRRLIAIAMNPGPSMGGLGSNLTFNSGLGSQALYEAEQRRLIAIAMNPGPSIGGLGSNLTFNSCGMSPGFNTPLVSGSGLSSAVSLPQHHPHPFDQHNNQIRQRRRAARVNTITTRGEETR
jgi:hypothetical protein